MVPEFLFNDKEALNQKIMKSVLREIAWKKHLRPGNFLSRKQMHIKGALFPEAVLAMSALDEDTGIRYWLASCFDNGRLSVTPEDECEILKEYDNAERVAGYAVLALCCFSGGRKRPKRRLEKG